MNEVEFILQHGQIRITEVQDFLMHAYDPVKAHDYYMRTRKLVGRTKAADAPFSVEVYGAKREAALNKRKEVKARIDAQKARLEKLRTLLRELVKQAQARSGVDPKDTKTKATAGTKKLNAAERKKAAKASKEYREEHKSELEKESLTDQEKRIEAQVEEVKAKIEKAREDLKAAIAKARARSQTKTPGSSEPPNS